MKYYLYILFLLFSFTISGFAQQTNNASAEYSYKTPDRDGTGKVYMGREIASVMSFSGKNWLERPTRPKEENTALAIANLPISKESTVADIGAGSGYYTFRIAEVVPEGKVYAVEIQDAALRYLENRSKELGYGNVEVIKGSEKSPNLPNQSIDLAIMVDVYHELLYPKEVLKEIHKALKPDGKLLLIEYRAEDPKVNIKRLHKMSVNQINKELNANGFDLKQNGQFMNIQHFLVYEKITK